ncbi:MULTISPECIES: MFS transporter [Virgibacillus]|uniref:MFS transporter n=1 Tax=Virgibacillus TaxID=84406 RepID=UPI00056F2A55|nr:MULTISPECIES: MFS transporter [Virgibacillus]
MGILLYPLNSAMIAIALTRLQHDFNFTYLDAPGLSLFLYLVSAAGQPIMGKLSKRYVRSKRLFMAELTIVSLASILAPISPNYLFLLVCRALQAMGSSSGMSMIRTFISEGQGRAIAIL